MENNEDHENNSSENTNQQQSANSKNLTEALTEALNKVKEILDKPWVTKVFGEKGTKTRKIRLAICAALVVLFALLHIGGSSSSSGFSSICSSLEARKSTNDFLGTETYWLNLLSKSDTPVKIISCKFNRSKVYDLSHKKTHGLKKIDGGIVLNYGDRDDVCSSEFLNFIEVEITTDKGKCVFNWDS